MIKDRKLEILFVRSSFGHLHLTQSQPSVKILSLYIFYSYKQFHALEVDRKKVTKITMRLFQ